MNAHRRKFLMSLLAIFGLASLADAQVSRNSSYSPYGGNSRTSSGATYSGISVSFTPQISFGPFGPQLSYPTSVGYVMVPAFPGVPSYFGPTYGVTLNGQRVAGIGYLQGSVDSLTSSRYQGSSSGSSSSQGQQDTGTRKVPAKAPEVHRRRFEQFLDERAQINPDEMKRKQQQTLLIHSLVNPTKQEITSGVAMNAILESLAMMLPQFKEAPEMPIDAELVKQLNFTKGSGTGSFGLLSQEGKIPWTASLLALAPKDETADLRTAIEKDFLEAYQQVSTGKADAETLKQVQRQTDRLSDLVSANVRSMDIKDYLEAKQFLKSLAETVTFLKQPDASDWLPGKSKIKPRTMQELVHIMSEKGIRFAPALVGNDEAYLALQRMLVTMHNAVAPIPAKK